MLFDDTRTRLLVDSYRHAVTEGWIQDAAYPEITKAEGPIPITARTEHLLWQVLSKLRRKLKRVGYEIPTLNNFKDRLWVEPTGPHSFVTQNMTKDNVYHQTRDEATGLWICDCPSHTEYCKHLDAVQEYLDVKHLNPPKEIESMQMPEDLFLDPDDMLPSPQAPQRPPSYVQIDWSLYSSVDLTEDQLKCLNILDDWFNTSSPLFRLTGPAGTGKSTVITAFVKFLIEHQLLSPYKILMASAFNKAVKVIREKLYENKLDGIMTSTLCQALGLREQKEQDKIRFVRVPGKESAIGDFKLVIIDEASTIAEELWEFLQEDQAQGSIFGNVRMVVMGDPYQLPPVNEAESLALSVPTCHYSLTQVMRHGGPILDWVTHIRENIHQKPQYPHTSVAIDRTGLWLCDTEQWFNTMAKGFKSENYRLNAQHCRAIAWTNERVRYLNQKIRNFLGHGAHKWVVGERVIAMAPYFTEGKSDCLLTNSQEAELLEFSEGEYGEYEVWFFVMRNDEDVTVCVPVIHENSVKQFKSDLQACIQEKRWAKYWRLQESYAQLEYAYAMTAHKAQGSTFVNTWVDLPNFLRNNRTNEAKIGKVREAAQLAYVGASRAKSRLFVLSNV